MITGKYDFEDKYHLTQNDNVYLAKRNIIDLIYKSAKLEGIAVTYAQTADLYEKGLTSGLKVDDVIKINDLKHAWRFLLETVDYPCDLMYIRQINKYIGEGLIIAPGELRSDEMTIGGTAWKPDIPDYDEVKSSIQDYMDSDMTATEKAVSIMCELCRRQLFSDGNKRTATLVANQILIQNGAGILAVPDQLDDKFKILLLEYYETGDMDKLKKFLYDQCIEGYELNKEKKNPEINRSLFYKRSELSEEQKSIIKKAVSYFELYKKAEQMFIDDPLNIDPEGSNQYKIKGLQELRKIFNSSSEPAFTRAAEAYIEDLGIPDRTKNISVESIFLIISEGENSENLEH